MLQNQYPALWQFFGAYLHQDWHAEYATTDEALDDFVTGEPELALLLPAEINALLSTASGEDLGDVIQRLGSFFVPSLADMDARTWLLNIAERSERS